MQASVAQGMGWWVITRADLDVVAGSRTSLFRPVAFHFEYVKKGLVPCLLVISDRLVVRKMSNNYFVFNLYTNIEKPQDNRSTCNSQPSLVKKEKFHVQEIFRPLIYCTEIFFSKFRPINIMAIKKCYKSNNLNPRQILLR
jgi:hypothetical protein